MRFVNDVDVLKCLYDGLVFGKFSLLHMETDNIER